MDKVIETGGEYSETGVHYAKDSETDVPKSWLAVPQIVRPVSRLGPTVTGETGLPIRAKAKKAEKFARS